MKENGNFLMLDVTDVLGWAVEVREAFSWDMEMRASPTPMNLSSMPFTDKKNCEFSSSNSESIMPHTHVWFHRYNDIVSAHNKSITFQLVQSIYTVTVS